MTKDELIPLLIRALPQPEAITELDTATSEDAIRFTWRDVRYRVTTTLFVEEAHDGVLESTDRATLISRLLTTREQLEF